MSKWITAKQFHDEPGTAGWHVLYGGAQTVFRTGSFARGVEFVRLIAVEATASGREPDVDLRPEAVVVRTAATVTGKLDRADADLARRVSSAASTLGLEPDPSQLHTMQIAIAEAEATSTREFWMAALGYESHGGLIIDPLRRGPRMWFDEIRTPRRGRTHIDVAVPTEQAEERVATALAAGGRLADETHVPEWWTLASPDNHGLDIAAWNDTDETDEAD
jgi:4a-hydroxytetrahydrobiopterin dehydratase